ncbi:siroheme synthase CysG [Saccharospirillum mangrovi]|uniref:siroheme synthase CysG n=1 Tax=Saccharospirillum mangrovi TaxID=2161747 RepID=UPI000D397D4E|nr:siroheme synthase CysG [Saccharospirillum mangrovi]
MHYFPLFHRLQDKTVLVVGGGDIALRKISLLRRAGCRLTVVAPTILKTIQDWPECTCIERGYVESDLDGVELVVAATDDDALNRTVSANARARRVLVNVVDSPDLCDVIFPSIVDRDPLLIAITSSGQAPVLARSIRAKLESTIPASYGQLAQLAARFRNAVKARFSQLDQRRYFWEKVLNGTVAEHVYAGRVQQAEQELQRQLDAPDQAQLGEVYLVGAGPGDPDLLTFKALRLMQQADVVLHDRLVPDAILDLVRRDAERLYVGKKRSDHAVPQQDINQLLVDLAQQGKRVLRLKGGDPFIFGRGGEEIDLLAANGIPFQVVPGITAASGCASYTGIPLTHRDYAQSVRFVTGHLKDGSLNLPWAELASPQQTVVFYMGLVGLPTICQQLIQHGRSPDTPIALVQKGTTPDQRLWIGTLATMPTLIEADPPQAPTLTIVGEVVSLHERLNWAGTVTGL